MSNPSEQPVNEPKSPEAPVPLSAGPTDAALVDAAEFQAAFGEPLSRTLDLNTWHPGEDLLSLYGRTQQEIEEAVRREDAYRERIRREVFSRLKRPGAPDQAGVYQARVENIEQVHRGLLFNGAVEACDGTSSVHDTLPITIVQIGVCLVSYRGDQGSWVQRLYRRDLRVAGLDPVEEIVEVLERRRRRDACDVSSRRDTLSDLGRRGIMTYAERAVLLRKSEAPWRMGHGNPTPYELLTGSGSMELLTAGLEVLRELILEHRRFVFIPSGPAERLLLTIGNALRPLEYAIVDTMTARMERIVGEGHYDRRYREIAARFVKEVGEEVVVGVYRCSALAPPHLFYAHRDQDLVHLAALIALADSLLQEHRGFPMLIDLADTVCSATFGSETLIAPVELAYLETGAPYRYLPERATRR